MLPGIQIKPFIGGGHHICEHLNGTIQWIKHALPVGSMLLAAFYQQRRATVVPTAHFGWARPSCRDKSKTTFHAKRVGKKAAEETLPTSLPGSNGDSYLAKPTAPAFPGLPAATTIPDHGAVARVCTSPGRCRMLRHSNLEHAAAGGTLP